MDLYSQPLGDWEFVSYKEDISVYRKYKGKELILKGEAIIKNVKVEKLLKLIMDIDIRRDWDKMLQNLALAKKINENEVLIYYQIISPVPFVSNRDFLQKRIFI